MRSSSFPAVATAVVATLVFAIDRPVCGSVVLTVDSGASSASTGFEFSVNVAGTLIGDYDATSNPGGTQTRPGLFGGSGNNPIPFSAIVALADDTIASPTGELTVDIDLATSTIAIDGLVLDLLAGETAAVGVSFTISFNSFNTINPIGIFPGGIPITLPLGDVATIESVTATQTTPVVAPLFGGKGGIHTVVALVPVDVAIVGDIFGLPIGDGTPIPFVLPLVGTLDLSVPGVATLSAGGSQTVSDGGPADVPFADIPFGLPTLTGQIANILLSGSVTDVVVTVDLDFEIVASGPFDQCAPADLNCDGVVDAADLGLLLAAWGTDDPDADLNGDGVVDAADLGLLLAAWG